MVWKMKWFGLEDGVVWKTGWLEDGLVGRQFRWKTVWLDDDFVGRQFAWKTVCLEDEMVWKMRWFGRRFGWNTVWFGRRDGLEDKMVQLAILFGGRILWRRVDLSDK